MRLHLNMPSRIPKILRNRFALVILFFLFYITFFDAHDLISQMRVRWKLHQINEQMEYLEKDTKEARAQIEELTTNKESLEKFAREQYRMKRENEDVFVILSESNE